MKLCWIVYNDEQLIHEMKYLHFGLLISYKTKKFVSQEPGKLLGVFNDDNTCQMSCFHVYKYLNGFTKVGNWSACSYISVMFSVVFFFQTTYIVVVSTTSLLQAAKRTLLI